MINEPSERPLYTVYGSKKRTLLPKIGSLFGLSLIFYVFVLINISLLELDADQETTLKTGALIILALLILLVLIITYNDILKIFNNSSLIGPLPDLGN